MADQAQATDTLVTFILDKSGSMGSVYGPTCKGFDTFINDLRRRRKSDGEIFVTLVTYTFSVFNTFSLKPVHKVPPLKSVYRPDGENDLYLAIVKGIRLTDMQVRGSRRPMKPIVVIQTDGDTHSRGTAYSDVKALIKEKEAEGWQFIFMACGTYSLEHVIKDLGYEDRYIYYDQGNVVPAFSTLAANTVGYAAETQDRVRITDQDFVQFGRDGRYGG